VIQNHWAANMAATNVTCFNPHLPLRAFLSLARERIEMRVEFVLYAADLTENYVAFNKGDITDPATLGG